MLPLYYRFSINAIKRMFCFVCFFLLTWRKAAILTAFCGSFICPYHIWKDTCMLNSRPSASMHSCWLFSSAWLCQLSYCHGAGVRRPSVVRKLEFLGNRCMDLCQILWVARSPPYVPTFFLFCCCWCSFFKIFHLKFCNIFFSLTWDPMGAKNNQNATPPVFIRSEPNFMINNVLMGEYKVMDILAICQKQTKKCRALWKFC